MSHPNPLISVLIPAYKATGSIRRAVESVLDCDVRERVQIAVAVDDDEDYTEALKGLPITWGKTGMKSGAGPARNRALAVAQGEYLTMLDADDTVSPGYLDHMLAIASERGACFSLTDYLLDGEFVRRIPQTEGNEITHHSLMLGLGSIHSLAHRKLLKQYRATLTQDVVAEAFVLHQLGGSAPLCREALYTINMSRSSVCGSTAQERFEQAHLAYAAEGEPAFHSIFDYRAAIDRLYILYLQAGGHKMFQQWVADHFSGPTSAMLDARRAVAAATA